MIFGFTGTKQGMTEAQKTFVRSIFRSYRVEEFHHGDCIGADKEAHDIATMEFIRRVLHPPTDPKYRAYCKGDVILEEKPYLVRDKDIVNAVDYMIGTPKGFNEELRSGTWATIRYAKKINRRLRIIYPDGNIEDFNETALYF